MCPPVGSAHSSMSEDRHTVTSSIVQMMEFDSKHEPLTFTGDPVHVTQLVTAATVTLIGSVNIGALLTAGVAVAFVEVCGLDEKSVNEARVNMSRLFVTPVGSPVPSQFLPSSASLKPVVQLHL